MKGVVLAGGRGVRLRRLTGGRNKHLMPVGGVPMIVRSVEQVARAGLGEILVVTSPDHLDSIQSALDRSGGAGGPPGETPGRLTFRVQEEPRGIAHALALAEEFAEGGPVMVLLADNVFDADLAPHVQAFGSQGDGALVFLKEVDRPEEYGVAVVAGDRVVRIAEKPQHAESRMAVTGIYAYDHRFADLIRTLAPGPRGELEITDLNNRYADEGLLRWTVLDGFWTDAGTEAGYERANAHSWIT